MGLVRDDSLLHFASDLLSQRIFFLGVAWRSDFSIPTFLHDFKYDRNIKPGLGSFTKASFYKDFLESNCRARLTSKVETAY